MGEWPRPHYRSGRRAAEGGGHLQKTHVSAGPEWRETAQKKAGDIVAEELRRRGWGARELEGRRKAAPGKMQMACRLRAETSLTFEWIAEHLNMGAPGYASNCLGPPNTKQNGVSCAHLHVFIRWCGAVSWRRNPEPPSAGAPQST